MARFSKMQVINAMASTGMVPVFYNKDIEISKSVVKACYEGGVRAFEFTNRGDFAQEVFADRAYEEDGTLVNRRKPGAMITDEDEAIRRVIGMVKDGKVTAITGKEVAIQADSICVHGDGEKALAFVKKIREALTADGIEIKPF